MEKLFVPLSAKLCPRKLGFLGLGAHNWEQRFFPFWSYGQALGTMQPDTSSEYDFQMCKRKHKGLRRRPVMLAHTY